MTRHNWLSPALTYLTAVVASAVAFLLTLVLILQFNYPNLERVGAADLHPAAVAMLFSAILGAFFAALRPSHWLRLAVLSSSIFWGFFSVVFVCYLINDQLDWVPLGQALLALCSALAGALVFGRISNRVWQRVRA